MPETDTVLTVRISPRIKLAAERQAKRDELSLSDVTRMLLKAYAKGEIDVEFRVSRKRSSS
jgi:antitoxin component of RelBE/YafQ-DinJ toxin-antitoxin module